jgi:hypothetical protein
VKPDEEETTAMKDQNYAASKAPALLEPFGTYAEAVQIKGRFYE